MSEQYQRSGDYAFALEDRPYTPAELRVLIRTAIWERFSGWNTETNDEVPDLIVDVLREFGQLTARARSEKS